MRMRKIPSKMHFAGKIDGEDYFGTEFYIIKGKCKNKNLFTRKTDEINEPYERAKQLVRDTKKASLIDIKGEPKFYVKEPDVEAKSTQPIPLSLVKRTDIFKIFVHLGDYTSKETGRSLSVITSQVVYQLGVYYGVDNWKYYDEEMFIIGCKGDEPIFWCKELIVPRSDLEHFGIVQKL